MPTTSWLPLAADTGFSLHNLPYGIFSTPGRPRRVGVAIGDQILDLAAMDEAGLLELPARVLQAPSLNGLIRLGKPATQALRARLQALLSKEDSPLRGFPQFFVKQQAATLHMPLEIGDYTDFYSSIEHATNVGKMFRDPDNALLPNWRHLPVGYHGRASSIVLSGHPIRRPMGQVMPKGATSPVFQASARLDFELEMAMVIGKDSSLGEPVPIGEAEDYIFGLVLFNDWSARDIQQWEYVPLGPFLGKNFASSLSPWVVPLEALDPFRVVGPVQEPSVLPYLQAEGQRNFDIGLEVALQPSGGAETIISRSNFRYMYWNMAQQIAHHTVNGCNLRVGDLLASGTISGAEPGSYGSMLELSWAGSQPITLADGSQRSFLADGDTVAMRGLAEKDGIRVGFGEVRNEVVGRE